MSHETQNQEGDTTPRKTNPNYGHLNLGDVPPRLFPLKNEDKIFDDADFTPTSILNKKDLIQITIPENLDHKVSKNEHGGCF